MKITVPIRFRLRTWFGNPRRSLALFFISTLISELASNVVFVILLEKSYQMSERAANVGGVLIVQSAAQLLLASLAGSLVDRIGSRRAVALGLISQAAITFGLALSRSIETVYFLAGTITLARLVVTASRLVALRSLSSRTNLPRNNSWFSVMTGLGLFIGPATAAWLFLLFADLNTAVWIAGFILLLSVAPSRVGSDQRIEKRIIERPTFMTRLQLAWQFIRKNRSVWQPLVCLMNSVMITAAMVPVLSPFARQVGLQAEGTGILVAAYGLGTMLGPLAAGWIFPRAKLSLVLFVTGVLTPLGILALGFLDKVEWILVALTLTGIAGAALNLVVLTILQRVTPIDQRGLIMGVEQMLIGLGWVVALILITGSFSILSQDFNLRGLFLAIGAAGSLLVLSCGLANRKRIATLA